jgi:hypothetical protein
VTITKLQRSELYASCQELFTESSKGFRKCLLGEVDSTQICTMDNFTFTHLHSDHDDEQSNSHGDLPNQHQHDHQNDHSSDNNNLGNDDINPHAQRHVIKNPS